VTAFNATANSDSNSVQVTTVSAVPALAAPALSAPSNGAIVSAATPIPLAWSSVGGATSYELQVLSGATVVVDQPGLISTTWNIPNGLLATGAYTWKVRAIGPAGPSPYSGAFGLNVPAASTAPVLVSPSNGSSVSSTANITLTWDPVAGATAYAVQVTASGAASPTVNVAGITAANYTITALTLATGTTYSWQVNATSSGGTSAWSTPFTFTTLSAGLLRVQTVPAVPTRIYLDGIPRDNWALNWVKVTAGNYTLSFSDVYGYVTPTSVSVKYYPGGPAVIQPLSSPISIFPDTVTEVIVNFIQLGNLRVQTSPPLAATISSGGQPMDDWSFWTNILPGQYNVSFEPLTGYTTPSPITANVTAGATTSIVGNYVASSANVTPAPHGLLRVQTSPAVPSTISLNGTPRDGWGLNWVKMTAGNYTLSFSDVYYFDVPATVIVNYYPGPKGVVQPLSSPVSIMTDTVTEVIVNFVPLGNLRVETTPPLPATIYCNGNPIDDWTFWSNIEPGTYQISFEPMAGYITPASIPATVVAGAGTHVVGNYTTGISQVVP
jgi:hypothetical protein